MGTDGLPEEAGTTKENWMDKVRQDLKDMGTTWDEYELATEQNGINWWRNASIWMWDELRC